MLTGTAPTPTQLVTGDELAQMPDVEFCELVNGKIISMSPTNWKHGRYVSTISWHLEDFVQQNPVGVVLSGEVGVFTRRNPDTVRGVDVALISHERLAQVHSASFLDVAPEVVVEVISPGNTWQEMRQKIDEYFEAGVMQLWIVEPERKQLLVYDAPTRFDVFTTDDTLAGTGVLYGFTLDVGKLFEL